MCPDTLRKYPFFVGSAGICGRNCLCSFCGGSGICADGAGNRDGDPGKRQRCSKKSRQCYKGYAILIAVAGYLNFADVDLGFKDKEASTDSSSILEEVEYDLTDETALLDENGADSQGDLSTTGTPGEAVLTGASDFAAQAKLSREQVRSQNKAELQEIIGNTDISEEKKQEAINTMVSMTELAEKEAAAELLLEAKGFENVVVNLTGETADIVVPDSALEDAQRAQIEDIVKRKTGIAAENIVITPLSQSSDEAEAVPEGEEELEETNGEAEEIGETEDSGEASGSGEDYEEQETSAEASDEYVIQTEGIYD